MSDQPASPSRRAVLSAGSTLLAGFGLGMGPLSGTAAAGTGQPGQGAPAELAVYRPVSVSSTDYAPTPAEFAVDGLDVTGYRLAGWSWGMWDWNWWQKPEAGRVAKRLARKASSGDIVVIHDGHHADDRADRRHAAETVRLPAPVLTARGFTFGTLCRM